MLEAFARQHAIFKQYWPGSVGFIAFSNGLIQQSELRAGTLQATITNTRTLRAGKVVLLKMVGSVVEQPEQWEINRWMNHDFFPAIRAHFDPSSKLQVKVVLNLLGMPAGN